MGNTTKEEDEDVEVVVTVVAEIVVVKTTMKREDKRISKTGVDEAALVEEVIVQIIQMLNVTISKSMDVMQKIAMPRRKWKKRQI